MNKNFCFRCDGQRCPKIWFKVKDHYLDLKNDQLEDFLERIRKSELNIDFDDGKKIEIIKGKTKLTLIRHECGPEIISDFFVAGVVTSVIEIFKFLLKKISKRKGERPIFNIYINKVEVTFLNREEFEETIDNSLNQKRAATFLPPKK
ncbi:MAG: hypothetical protein K9L85_01505 [Candidatus Peribacteraceae bacterium]|nr:hypothetical protein [Candidatus Peribacteraceae bacterium]